MLSFNKKKSMIRNYSVKNILFVQDSSPCIRTIKMATALYYEGLNIHLVHRNKTPDEAYGYGNSSFKSISILPKYRFKDIKFIKQLIIKYNIDLVHFHNQPDQLGAKLIGSKLGIPIIYDQHDFMSFKHHLSRKEKKYELICNENADGSIYITEAYKNEVSKYYNLIDNSICFGNYFPQNSNLKPANFLPKISLQSKKLNLVYLGRISEHKRDHRNIINIVQLLSDIDFIIHIYPSKNKKYSDFNRISNVIIHDKLPYNELIKDISQYDFGITAFNDEIASKLPHIKYAFGNKTYDYLCAGIPVLVQKCLDEVLDFIINNGFGFTMENYDKYNNLSSSEYSNIVLNIIQCRNQFSMENQIHRIIKFYEKTVESYYNV